MGQVRHRSATTTHAVRAALQRSQASLAQVRRELGINPTTVAKWRKRATVEDRKAGPTEARSAAHARAVAYPAHTILTTNCIGRAEQPRNRNTICSRPMRFDMICEASGIWHRLTKPNHPRTNGQVERTDGTIKDATAKRYRYDAHARPHPHLADCLAPYNFARRLKALSGLRPCETICKVWTSEPDRFIANPIHQMLGRNS